MKKIIIIFFSVFLFASNCNKQLFSLSIQDSIPLKDILNSISVECSLTIIPTDKRAKDIIKTDNVSFVNINNATFREFLTTLFDATPLYYKLKDNKLYVSYYKTKTFKIDFIPSKFEGNSNVSSEYNNVTATYDFDFWKNLSKNLENIWVSSKYKFDDEEKLKKMINSQIKEALNSMKLKKNEKKDNAKSISFNIKVPEINNYPIAIDRNSGLVVVIGNKTQIRNISKYIKELKKRVTKEVLIDVKIYSVELSSSHKTGIDWSQLNVALSASNVPLRASYLVGSQSIFNATNFNASAFLNFLAQNGNVNSISNPKIVTLNNQKAIISIGDTVNYKYVSSVTYENGTPIQNYSFDSKFVGILLDITPQISDNNEITLRINPKISSFKDLTQLTDTNRDLPPDTKENTLMTTVRLRSNQTLVLGGLITNDSSFKVNGVPILKEIPLIKYLFSSKEKVTNKKELVFVITPRIINLNKSATLKDFGYKKLPTLEDLDVK